MKMKTSEHSMVAEDIVFFMEVTATDINYAESIVIDSLKSEDAVDEEDIDKIKGKVLDILEELEKDKKEL